MSLIQGVADMGNRIKIVFATGNPHKVQEVNDIADGSGIEFIMPPRGFNPIENGANFEQNSYIKAREAAVLSGSVALADDSGLCVEALDGQPGIYSARYDVKQKKRIDKLLYNLAPFGNRKVKFVCAMTLVDKDGNILHQVQGECHGKIAKTQAGTNGFGYDPIFIPDGYNETIAQMPESHKNKISHRGNALRMMIDYIQNNVM